MEEREGRDRREGERKNEQKWRIVLSTTSCRGRMVGTIWYELIQMYLLYMHVHLHAYAGIA